MKGKPKASSEAGRPRKQATKTKQRPPPAPESFYVAPDGSSPSGVSSRPAWGVLVYLAGDVAEGHEAIRADLAEILKAGASDQFHIAVQYDGPGGAERYVLPGRAAAKSEPVQRLGRVDSGSANALLDFLRWGMAICDTERVAVIFGSPVAIGFD